MAGTGPRKVKLEDYRQGYPRLAAFLTLDKDFTILRNFSTLHMRVLLESQERLVELEEQLNQTDDDEQVQLNLSSRRQDNNQRRHHLVERIKQELREYDTAVLNFHSILALPQAQTKNIRSVENWVNGTKPLVRSESHWILGKRRQEDYIALKPDDADRAGFESLFDITVRRFPRLGRLLCRWDGKTDDANIYLFPRTTLKSLMKIIFAFIIPLWLILPGICLYQLSGHRQRAIVYALFTFGTSFLIHFLTNATRYNVLLGVTTYGAVLSAFLSAS